MFVRVSLVGEMGIQRGIKELCFLNIASGLVLLHRKSVEVFLVVNNIATIIGEFKIYSAEEVAEAFGASPKADEPPKFKKKNNSKGE